MLAVTTTNRIVDINIINVPTVKLYIVKFIG